MNNFELKKELKQELQESGEKFRLLFDTIPDALYIIDQETGKILDVNKAAEKMYGYSREEWLQMKNTDVSAEPDKTKEDFTIPKKKRLDTLKIKNRVGI